MLSNSIPYDFDQKMTELCAERSLIYSRYADDIRVSGNGKTDVQYAVNHGRSFLAQYYKLRIREDKTRIASRGVTGVIVNHHPVPPRTFRRRVRAIFHLAGLRPTEYLEQIAMLQGYVGFLKSFPVLREATKVIGYERILAMLRAMKQRAAPGGQGTATR
jgi:RNA-directed DNA polymerase